MLHLPCVVHGTVSALPCSRSIAGIGRPFWVLHLPLTVVTLLSFSQLEEVVFPIMARMISSEGQDVFEEVRILTAPHQSVMPTWFSAGLWAGAGEQARCCRSC